MSIARDLEIHRHASWDENAGPRRKTYQWHRKHRGPTERRVNGIR